ncbi:hypothetical protein NDU88_007918 [Pleurodeles waltl]|uniref:Uncharacterized protein n=1 Tax=Pleurodeles waltl TaxID=8319 RepID=A0AAV7NZA7_PLEWA|nr:hypothetical protein NDU88_007918 [Pleurodeles waltl]
MYLYSLNYFMNKEVTYLYRLCGLKILNKIGDELTSLPRLHPVVILYFTIALLRAHATRPANASARSSTDPEEPLGAEEDATSPQKTGLSLSSVDENADCRKSIA